jgi:hypothetical protein
MTGIHTAVYTPNGVFLGLEEEVAFKKLPSKEESGWALCRRG